MEEYTTLAQEATDEFVERRSRFIGVIRPVSSEEDALAFIKEIKTAHWDATHNVYAYILRSGTVRCSDDGEPQGTAGVPTLDVLQKEGLTDVAVVVTRYFGGVLLGAGGLVRAYSRGASCAVAAAKRKTFSECSEFALELGYDFYGKITYLLPDYAAAVIGSDFGEVVRLRVLMKDCDVARFQKELAEQTAARVVPRLIDRRYACIEDV